MNLNKFFLFGIIWIFKQQNWFESWEHLLTNIFLLFLFYKQTLFRNRINLNFGLFEIVLIERHDPGRRTQLMRPHFITRWKLFKIKFQIVSSKF